MKIRKNVPLSAGFTLIELMVVLAIVALLGVLAVPEFEKVMDRARSTGCLGNLRQIGSAVNLYVADNDGRYPYINNPARPLYTADEDLPPEIVPQTMLEAFSPYGVDSRTLRCPADVIFNNRHASEGTSYEWRPILDGEEKVSPTIYTRRGAFNLSRLSRFRLVIDTDPVHSGRQNRLYADGRVQGF